VNTFDDFMKATDGAQHRQATAAADTRTAEQIAEHVGDLFNTAMDAFWNRADSATIRAAAKAFADAMAHPSSACLYIHTHTVNTGDYIQANGLDLEGRTASATGIVEEIDYESRDADPYNLGETSDYHGVTFAIRPVVAEDQPEHEQVLIWVFDLGTPNVLRLPKPTHHTS
jgi:hypothetical protein